MSVVELNAVTGVRQEDRYIASKDFCAKFAGEEFCSEFDSDPSSSPKLVTLRGTVQRSGAFILVAKDQSPLFQIVG